MEWNNDDEHNGGDVESEVVKESSSTTKSAEHKCGHKKSFGIHILALLLIIASILWIVSYLGLSYRPFAAAGDASEWKAVFLANGQVYFGKVRNEQADPLVLENIYYLQVQQQLQPTDPTQQAQQSLTLIKFGSELHGPQDQMRIVRDNVLYIESLKNDGRVVDAIDRYLAEQAEE